MLMTLGALLITIGISAQNAAQTQAGKRTQTKTQTEKQNRSSATIQTQTQGQYQNYGQMTSEQKQIRNQERKALKNEKKMLKKQQKEMKKQEAAQNREQYKDQIKTANRNKGARTATPQRNAAKVSKSAGPGKK